MRLIFLALVIGLFMISFSSALLTDGLIHYYSFDDSTTMDRVGIKNLSNVNISTISGLSPYSGNAIYCNETNLSMLNNSIFYANNMTISFWYNSSKDQGGFLLGSQLGGNYNINMYQDYPTNRFTFYATSSKSINNVQNSDYISKLITMVIQQNGTGEIISLYVNTTNIGNISFTPFPWTQNSNINFSICARADASNYLVAGSFDEMGIWNRTLSPSEITQIYNNNIPLNLLSSNYMPNVSSLTFNRNITETQINIINFNISYNNSLASFLSSQLVYNNSVYNYSSITINESRGYVNGSFILYNIIDKPQLNISLFLNYSLNYLGRTTYYNSTIYNQTINALNFSICEASPMNTPFLNISFKNETSLAESVSSILSSSFIYWTTNQAYNKTYSFTNISENRAYTFCALPKYENISLSMSGTYSNSYSQQRSFSNNTLILSNRTTNYTLWLLPNSAGSYISFQVRTFPTTAVSGVFLTVKKSSDGTLVASGYTDDTGIASFWLSPTTLYTITTSKDGYTDLSTSITPSLTSYSLTIVPTGGFATDLPIANVVEGISILIQPSSDILSNNTYYNFNFIIGSVGSRLDSYGFNIINSAGSILGSTSGSSSGGSTLSLYLNTLNNSYLQMRYYYIIDGNYSNDTRKWVVVDQDGTSWSILNFVNDLKSYLNSSTGFFGIKSGTGEGDFTLAIIIFIIIFSFAGVMSYSYGLTGGTVIAGLIFTAVMFFDVGLGLMPNPLGVTNLPTIFIGAIFLAFLMKEAMS